MAAKAKTAAPPTVGHESANQPPVDNQQVGDQNTGGQENTIPKTDDQQKEDQTPVVKELKTPKVQRTKTERITESLQAVGADVLAKNPQFETVYVTANGYVFPVECDAINHAKTLKNQNVETVIRQE